MGKRGFLDCYFKARQRGLSVKNVLAGWKVIGLWPFNCTKPLMNRLVLNMAKLQPIELQQFNQV